MNKLKRVFITCLSFVSMASIVCHANTVRPYAGMSESLEIHILQLGDDEAPRIHQAALAAIKEMNVPDHQLLLTWAKLQRLLAATHFIENGLLLERSRDAIFVLLMDLDAALGGLLPLLASGNKDESILARAVIDEISEALKKSKIQPLPGTAPLLAKALSSQNVRIRETASRLLGVIPAHAEAAVPGLIVAMNDENQDVQTAAVAASGEIAVAIPAVHPEIVKTLIALTHDSRYVQIAAVDALGDIAKAIPEVQLEIAERLIELLNTPNFLIAPWGLKPQKSHGFQRRSFDYSNFHVRLASNLGSIGAAAVPLLVEAMNATDPSVRHHAAIALAGISPEHDEATIPILIEALASPHSVTREIATYNFVELAKQSALVNKVLHALVQLLESTDDTVENRVARPEAVAALYGVITSSIYNLEEDSSTPVVNPEKKLEIVEKLIAALNTPNFVTGLFGRGRKHPSMGYLSNFHVDVVKYLLLIGDAVVPLLVEAMEATDAGVRHHAAIALAQIGSQHYAAIVAGLRHHAAIASEHYQATIPILAEALASPHLHTRKEAVYTLKRLAEQAPLADEISSIFANVLETTSYVDVILYGSTFHDIVASVAGALTHINTPAAIELLQSENSYVQELVATAIAYATIQKPEMVGPEIKQRVIEILALSTIKEIGNQELIAKTKRRIEASKAVKEFENQRLEDKNRQKE